MRRTILLCSAVVALACAPADNQPSDTTVADTATQPSLAPAPTAGSEPATTPATSATPGARRTIHVVLNEWSVSPSERSPAAGPVTFHVMNQGTNHHALEVQRGSQEWETTHIAPGGTATVNVDLTAGTYTLYCPVVDAQGNHRQRGMSTTLTVR